MITNNDRIRIRRQMQQRIRDVVAERRRARLLEIPADPATETASAEPRLTTV